MATRPQPNQATTETETPETETPDTSPADEPREAERAPDPDETEDAVPTPDDDPPEHARSAKEWLAGAPLSPLLHIALGLGAPMLLVLWNAWRVRSFTIDDAYISFRYAENLANGHGLVYNLGERVEGYTNFLWTLLLALAARLGAPTEAAAKVLGVLSACAALVPTYLLSRRLRPLTTIPSLAPWLLASSFLFTGYSIFGLETPLFIALILAGTELFFREEERESGVPWSGLVFALAALTRPEAPLFLGLLAVWQASPHFGRRSLARAALFVIPVALHILWRHHYYGSFLPNTLAAKTGDFEQQLRGGRDYLQNYVGHAKPIVWIALVSVAISIARKRREGLAIGSIVALYLAYVLAIGGDWMPYFRFVAPAEPFLFLLVDDAIRAILGRRERAATIAIAAFAVIMGISRAASLSSAQRDTLKNTKGFWDDAAGRTAEWLVKNGTPGPLAILDIGYVGYRTGYPIIDMLGLLTPEIAKLPGGYTRKVGPGYTDALFARDPRYFLIISSQKDCKSPSVPGSRAAYNDPRFRRGYRLRQAIALQGGAAWCIYEKTNAGQGS